MRRDPPSPTYSFPPSPTIWGRALFSMSHRKASISSAGDKGREGCTGGSSSDVDATGREEVDEGAGPEEYVPVHRDNRSPSSSSLKRRLERKTKRNGRVLGEMGEREAGG